MGLFVVQLSPPLSLCLKEFVSEHSAAMQGGVSKAGTQWSETTTSGGPGSAPPQVTGTTGSVRSGAGPGPHSPVGHFGKAYSVLIGSKPRSRSFRRERRKAGAVGPSRGPDQEPIKGRTCPAAAGVGGRLPADAPMATEGVVIIWMKVVRCNAFQGAHQLDAFYSECGVPGAISARTPPRRPRDKVPLGPGGPGPSLGRRFSSG